MPNIAWEQFIPSFPLHWTTIIHYLILVIAIILLTISGDKVGIIYTILLGVVALAVGIDLYFNKIGLLAIVVFFGRLVMVGVPIVIVGMADNEQARALAIVMTALGLVLLVLFFASFCIGPVIGDPRVFTIRPPR